MQATSRIAELGDALTMARGQVIGCYAQIEFHLADISIRASNLACYKGLNPKFPRKLEDRVKAVRRLVRADGPLQRFCDSVDDALGYIDDFSELRHLMAHGSVLIEYNDKDNLVYLEMYEIAGQERLRLKNKGVAVEKIEHAAERLALYTNTMVRLFLEMRTVLPPRQGTDGIIPDR